MQTSIKISFWCMAILTPLFQFGSLYGEGHHVIPAPDNIPAQFDLMSVFYSCPIIYGILLVLSLMATVIWIYSIATLRLNELMPREFTHTVRLQLGEKKYEEALDFCLHEKNMSAKIIASGLSARKLGTQIILDSIQSEGRRLGNAIWQRISLLNDIAVIAPMLGLLGTVLGLFFAFYDSTKTTDNLVSIFDGLGIAVGTTVAGLIVAIMAMVFYTSLKYRVVNVLNTIENESLALATLIESDPSSNPNTH